MIKIKDLFCIKYGNSFSLSEMDFDSGGCNFIARGEKNNGVACKVAITNITPFEGNAITVSLGGSVLESFYQDSSFYTAYHIKVLYPKKRLTKKQMLYYCMIIRSNKYKYSYGRQANKTLGDIFIPSIEEIPYWVEEIQMPNKPPKEAFHKKKISLRDRGWKCFNLKDLFEIIGSKSFTKNQIKDYGFGECPYVVTSSENNGIQSFYNHYTEDGNVLTIDSATIGSCFYQETKFSASDHVEKLIPKFKMSKYIALFLTTVINLEQYRYGYGRKFSQTRIKQTEIKLPAKNNQPDWQFMEDYIKSLPYSANL